MFNGTFYTSEFSLNKTTVYWRNIHFQFMGPSKYRNTVTDKCFLKDVFEIADKIIFIS